MMSYVTEQAFRQFEKRMDERWNVIEEKLEDIDGIVTVIAQANVARAWLGPRGLGAARTLWALIAAVLVAVVAAVVTALLTG
jgi:hypothetical protein